MNIENITWKEILINKGFDECITKSFIGFIAWKQDEIFSKLGEEINDVLAGYEGKIVAKDVICDKYKSIGILFFNKDVSQDISDNIFNAIQYCEYNEVYDIKDIDNI
ncbi:hypothetical protein [Tepidibacter hydrothermalis]|uniref:Uncharacterized protein n=1 Tax=Tepidibacter hydrothermalis TaxID=3036126 RepID=A0ABY8EL84_9FIRM|nr:hypothetical protein [Tepidibacter hydrothermalis]WFD12043.1 hypothetical protein P4S50_08180 [Tepidibacter hydrothermalis]